MVIISLIIPFLEFSSYYQIHVFSWEIILPLYYIRIRDWAQLLGAHYLQELIMKQFHCLISLSIFIYSVLLLFNILFCYVLLFLYFWYSSYKNAYHLKCFFFFTKNFWISKPNQQFINDSVMI